MSNKGKWILVTGGSRGIGKGLVLALAEAGYAIVFTYKSSVDEATAIETQMKDKQCDVQSFQCDGTDFAAVEALCNRLIEERGCPHALINNLGVAKDELVFNMDIKNYLTTIETNLHSSVYFNRCLVPAFMHEGEGNILHMSSVTGIKGNSGQSSYAITKAGLIGLTKTMAVELARFNINVNAIAPGFIQTEMTDALPETAIKKINKMVPLKRMGTIAEVASLALYLISEDSRYITGQTLVVDGGLSV
jgi:3-oxoacyl-[acyl-carrier protein] reductase